MMSPAMLPVSSWGRLGAPLHRTVSLAERADAPRLIREGLPGLAHGMGRSYGDSCLNPGGTLWQTRSMSRMHAFDATTGRLTVEAGVLLRDIQRLMIPRGWCLPVTPGTQIVTVGGAIANDVHGKNHHRHGSFGDHVTRLTLARTDGETILCGPDQQPGWFAATVGGLGLTGVILEAELQLIPTPGPWVEAETLSYANLDEFFSLSDGSEAGWEHTVSWIDCITGGGGRGIFMRGNPVPRGNHPEPVAREKTMPFTPPVSAVNSLSLRAFNSAYFHLNRWKAGRTVTHYEPFFYPLDNLHEWNRMYGPKGFFQYQSVVPRLGGREAVQAMLKAIAKSGNGSFLAVLKTFGERQPVGMLSFPMPGVTLALDFPNRGAGTLKLFETLDAIVREAKGRIYPAKDARMPKDLFVAGYPRLNDFVTYRDPGISSGLSRRLMGQ